MRKARWPIVALVAVAALGGIYYLLDRGGGDEYLPVCTEAAAPLAVETVRDALQAGGYPTVSSERSPWCDGGVVAELTGATDAYPRARCVLHDRAAYPESELTDAANEGTPIGWAMANASCWAYVKKEAEVAGERARLAAAMRRLTAQ